MPALILSLMALLLVSCTTYKDDLKLICEVKIPDEGDLDIRVSTAMGGLRDQVKSPEGRKLYHALSIMAPVERPRVLQEETAEQGIASCSFAEWYKKTLAATP